ncbi:putative membrane protein [Janthinobacterium agaricidamnosum NBRC 102515 = DSM 9628]|uniref:Putative membrane protein n=1 Tax=Janthinobacterium agaricidamnosum NBRC 102515 = DSM 9628 TaxID=1349767 RepID=W0V2G4_9BURK|nr:putative membrane protein [Janthinobacterium agaricidamnosum NBRC 102515 = DSM 9628]
MSAPGAMTGTGIVHRLPILFAALLGLVGSASPALACALHRTWFYRWLLGGASLLIMLALAAWLVERTFGVQLTPL